MRSFAFVVLGAMLAGLAPAHAGEKKTHLKVTAEFVGPYVGTDFGLGSATFARVNQSNIYNTYHGDGFVGGAHGGYNLLLGHYLLGLESDIYRTSIEADDGGFGTSIDQTNVKWLGSVRQRIGVTWDNKLIFLTGGWAFARLEQLGIQSGKTDAYTTTVNGWVIGAGAEVALDDHWSIRSDFRRYDFGHLDVPAPKIDVLPYRISTVINTVTIGIDYKF